MRRISFDQKVPNYLAFLILISLIFIVSWFTISEGKKISENSKNSPVFNIPQRAQINNVPELN